MKRALVLAALLAPWSARAEVVSLADLEQRALQRHTELKTGALRVRAAAAEVEQTASAFRPKVGLSVDVNAQPGRVLAELPPQVGLGDDFFVQGVRRAKKEQPTKERWEALTPRPRAGAGVQFDANLYDFGRRQVAMKAGQAKRRAAEADVELSRDEVVGSVRAAYLTWLSTHQLHALAAAAAGDAARRSERVAALIQEGARPRTDLAPSDAERMLSELERERSIGDLESARLSLEQAVGEPLSGTAEPDLALLARPFPTTAPGDRHPAAQLLVEQRAALQATVRLQQKQRLPLLSTSIAAGMYGQLTQEVSADEEQKPKYRFRPFPMYSLGLALTVPLWDGGGAKAAAAIAAANAAELTLRLESLDRERQQEFERARLAAEHAERRRAIAEQLLEVCKVRVADTEAGYELGAMPFEQVQQARSLLRRAETELVLAKVARTEAVLRVTTDR